MYRRRTGTKLKIVRRHELSAKFVEKDSSLFSTSQFPFVDQDVEEHSVDALTEDADEGRGVAAISFGEVLSNR